MSAPLTPDLTAVDAEVFLRSWLLPITAGPGSIGSKMWATNLPKPYRTVRRVTGPQTLYSDEPVMHVHTFGGSYGEAATAAAGTDARMRVLLEYPGWGVTLSDGRVVHCDWVEIIAAAHEEPYSAESVVTRFVSEYRLGLSFVPAT
ncbi:hypothetical protein [Mycolicibacterium poriferae]|uniref:hypothetical protein n=1 Tax=Mycolicibacterium poriferae TaxID=39694 RepID=UPI0024B87968|nr:hypothetical protein [Mycolicibacterium poriferae]